MASSNAWVLAAMAALVVCASAQAQPERRHEEGGEHGRFMSDVHPGPHGYQRPEEPGGWNQRPSNFDRGSYARNFQAPRAYRIGPYHAPRGWAPRRWSYGQILPRSYWSSPYILGDYWLFGLEIPPVGFEWVRAGSDALLINTRSGEILQVEYGLFY
jgi:Ni/Co efflux regulator RcnB